MVRVKKSEQLKETVKKTVKKTGLSIAVYDLEGKEEKTVGLPEEIFASKVNKKLLAQNIRAYLVNQRQGNASAKTRGEVNGTTKKVYRQKGTGRARHGASKAPIFVGGGVSGGPLTHEYSLKINKKQKRKAIFNALTLKYNEGSILGLSDKAIEIEGKTKLVAGFLKKMKLMDTKTLLILSESKVTGLLLAARNIPNVTVSTANTINPYLLINNQKIVFIQSSIESLKNHFLKKHEN